MRPRQIVAVGILGTVSAIALAFAPVEQETAEYAFRPARSGPGGGGAVASLGLVRAVPDALSVALPCDVPGSELRTLNLDNWSVPDRQVNPLPEAVGFPDLGSGLIAAVSDTGVSVRLGDDEILQASTVNTPGCVAHIGYARGVWDLTIGDESWSIEAPGPVVAEAAFVGSAASSAVSVIAVETRELGTSPTVLQLGLWLLVLVSAAMVTRAIVLRDRSRLRRIGFGSLLRSLEREISPVDVAVLLSMIGLILLIPPSYDDGWMRVISGSFGSVGDFSTVYENQGTLIPLGYWFYWLQHFWVDSSTSVFVIRLPMVALGTLSWAGLRALWSSRCPVPSPRGTWVMAAAYVGGFAAWGTMLRPEPVVAVLLLASVALAHGFRGGQRGWVLVAWVFVIALGLTVHTSGVVVLAPVLASWRSLWEWLRSTREEALVALSLLLLLGTTALALLVVDSSLAAESEWARAFRSLEGHSLSPFDELLRYQYLDGLAMSAMRRVSVAFIGIAIGGFAFARSSRDDLARLTFWTLVGALGLLALTPSKWPLHFGALFAVASLGLAFAVQARDRWRVAAQSLLIAGLMAWAWSRAWSWNDLDLRTQQWWPGASNLSPFDLGSLEVWLVVAASLLVLGHLRARKSSGFDRMQAPGVLVLVGAFLVLAMTTSTFVIDALRTDGWTFADQNLKSLWGADGCGLGDEIALPAPGSLRVLQASPVSSPEADLAADAEGFSGGPASLVEGGFPAIGFNEIRPLEGLGDIGSWNESSESAPDTTVGSRRSAWYAVDSDLVALMAMGAYGFEAAGSNAIAVQWGAAIDGTIRDLGVESVSLSGYFVDWKLVVLEVPPGADRSRLLLRDGSAGSAMSWVAASPPLGVDRMSLGEIAAESASEIMVTPQLALYMPCVPRARIDGPVADAPSIMILSRRSDTPALVWHTTFLRPATSDRYFLLDLEISNKQGDRVPVLLSQRYLSGDPARVNGEFVLQE